MPLPTKDQRLRQGRGNNPPYRPQGLGWRLPGINQPPVDCCGALEPQHEPRAQESQLALWPTHVGAAKGLLGPADRGTGLAAKAQGSISDLVGQGSGRGPRSECVCVCVPRADRPPSLPSTWSAASGLHTAQLENVTSLERFPRALPGSPPPRQAPSASFSWPVPQPPEAWGTRPAPASPREPPPPRRGLGCPRPPASARGGAGGSGAAGPALPSLPFPARRAARAYLCGPGRSRGRHPVV